MKRAELPIALPCHEDWDTMSAEGRTRFCGSCKKEVHDLSRLSEIEARLLVAKSATAPVCVRYLANRHGDVLLALVPSDFVPLANLRGGKASRLRSERKAQRVALKVGALAISVATLAACSSGTAAGAAPHPVAPSDEIMMMGEISPTDLPAHPAPSGTTPAPTPSASTAPAPETK